MSRPPGLSASSQDERGCVAPALAMMTSAASNIARAPSTLLTVTWPVGPAPGDGRNDMTPRAVSPRFLPPMWRAIRGRWERTKGVLVRRLRASWDELVDPAIAAHHGRMRASSGRPASVYGQAQ